MFRGVSVLTVTLENTKEWLKIESDDEDTLIQSFITAAEDIVEGILRFPLSEYGGDIPEPVKHAIYFTVSRFYEERNELDMKSLVEVLKALLFSQRKVDW
jgi:hypothetical protein